MNNLKKAKRWAKRLGVLPGVSAIFLSGSMAQGNSTPDSDIDFFIITEPGRIWTARFFVFVMLKLRGQLAKPHHHAGMICPNHFITNDHLEIQEKDAYSANLFSHNQPLYDPQDIFSRFIVQNQWVSDFNEKFQPHPTPNKPNQKNKSTHTQNITEQLLKILQIRITKENHEYQTPGAKIILTDTELRFHPIPRNLDRS